MIILPLHLPDIRVDKGKLTLEGKHEIRVIRLDFKELHSVVTGHMLCDLYVDTGKVHIEFREWGTQVYFNGKLQGTVELDTQEWRW